MYDLNKCSYFTTVGELRMLLADISDDADVFVGGSTAYLHVAPDNSLISFDYDNLMDYYDEWYPVDEEHWSDFWDEQEERVMEKHKMRLAAIAANKEKTPIN